MARENPVGVQLPYPPLRPATSRFMSEIETSKEEKGRSIPSSRKSQLFETANNCCHKHRPVPPNAARWPNPAPARGDAECKGRSFTVWPGHAVILTVPRMSLFNHVDALC